MGVLMVHMEELNKETVLFVKIVIFSLRKRPLIKSLS